MKYNSKPTELSDEKVVTLTPGLPVLVPTTTTRKGGNAHSRAPCACAQDHNVISAINQRQTPLKQAEK